MSSKVRGIVVASALSVAIATLQFISIIVGISPEARALQPACTIFGTPNDDEIIGTSQDDIICAGDGADFIDSGDGNDVIYAGNGVDVVKGGNGDDTIYGGQDADELMGDEGVDYLYGELGIDDLSGGLGDDFLYGGDDNDDLAGGDGNDLLKGELGVDNLDGEAGNDFVYGDQDNDWIYGSDGDDYLDGSFGSDELYGGDGNDQIRGKEDSDDLNGGMGNDSIWGSLGTDRIDGGPGVDNIDGENDHDTCVNEGSSGNVISCESIVNNTAADVTMSFINNGAPSPLDNDPLTFNNNKYESNIDGVTVTAPADTTGKVTLSGNNSQIISIGLPHQNNHSLATLSADKSVVFDSPNSIVDIAAQAIDGGVRLSTVQDSPSGSAVLRYDYPLTLPANSALQFDDNGQVVIKSSNNDYIGLMSTPWAADANGQSIPTHYEINGSQVTQVVDTTGINLQYPVTSDPFLGMKIINSVQRINSPQGSIYKVYPTWYGRVAGELVHHQWGWRDAVAKGVPNHQGLKEQYVCHPLPQVARFKESWNLDTWRPTVGLFRTIVKACNP